MRVMIVDDEPAARRSLREYCQGESDYGAVRRRSDQPERGCRRRFAQYERLAPHGRHRFFEKQLRVSGPRSLQSELQTSSFVFKAAMVRKMKQLIDSGKNVYWKFKRNFLSSPDLDAKFYRSRR
jgi:hypothetical protein